MIEQLKCFLGFHNYSDVDKDPIQVFMDQGVQATVIGQQCERCGKLRLARWHGYRGNTERAHGEDEALEIVRERIGDEQ